MNVKLPTTQFLAYLQSLGISLWADGDNLRFNAPKGGLTPELRAELVERKVELLNILRPAVARPQPTDSNGSAAHHPFTPPHTTTEKVLAQVWSQLLGREIGNTHDDFFELGGDSILATQLMSAVWQRFQVTLPLRDLFEKPTLSHLAENIDKAPQTDQALQIPPLLPILEKTDGRALSFAQQRSWFLDQLTPQNPFYNMPKAMRLVGQLNAAALERTLNEIVRRHDTLRTTFASIDGKPVPYVVSTLTLPLPLVDLQPIPASKREAEAQRLMVQEVQRPFDLSRGPLVRALLLRLDEEEHILLLTMHHIVSDGWSTGIVLHELAALYAAFQAGQPSPLPELPIQYSDFAAWQREWLQGERLARHFSYWQEQLEGLPVLELPTDHPRPAVQTVKGSRLIFQLPLPLSQKLEALSKQEGVTLFMFLLAAFQTLLYRYANQEDIVVGSPIANRNRAEIEGLIGFFANMLVMRTDFSGNPTFRELLQRVREVALQAYEHQDLPFEKLVEELQPERDLSRTPLFQVVFVLQNAPRSNLELPGLTLSSVVVDKGTATYDLNLGMWQTKQGLGARIEYNIDLFEAETIRRMADEYQHLLEHVTINLDSHVADLPILTPREEAQLRVWNDTSRAYSRTSRLHDLFEKQAEKTPLAAAATCADQTVTYQELNQRANQLAHTLQKLGVGPETLVGLCVERSLDMLVGLLGILKAGGAYLPLDPAFPTDRLSFMIGDAQTPVLLTQQKLAANLAALTASSLTQPTILCLDSDWETSRAMPQTAPPCLSTADNVAYTIYTSGSTGRPKGVQVLHHAVVNFLETMRQQPGLTAQDTLLSVTTLSFDIAVLELFLPLIVGAKVVLVGRDAAADGPQLLDTLTRSQATVMQATPSTWRLLLAAGWPGDKTLKILCGGEALPPTLAQQLLEHSASLWNMYGPTETTIWSAVHQIGAAASKIPIGRPIANTQIHLLDKRLRPVPIGVPGEIYIAGAGLARGYLGRSGLTAERFVPDSFSAAAGQRMYKTGDQGRYLADGTIEFLGRNDHQVKVRGFRIELGEIETALNRYPGVAEATLITYQDASDSSSLAAYVVPAGEQPPTSNDLRDHLRATLPEYMVPTAFVFLERLPLTPNGKIDRKLLPTPGRDQLAGVTAFAPPSTPFEEIMAEIWQELLRLETIGIYDNFFTLGGHSLLATQVISRVRDRFEVDLPVRTLFEAPTIATLGARIEQTLLAEIEALDEAEAEKFLTS